MYKQEINLEAGEHGLVLWTDVGAAAEGGDRHRVPVQDRQVVAVATVWNIVSGLAYWNIGILEYCFRIGNEK